MHDPNTPYRAPDDMHDKPEDSTGLFCFVDSSRPCTAECMAHLGARPEGRDYEGQQWAKCMVLVSLHKAGKHVVALAGQGDALLRHLRIKRADEVRETQPLPPPVK